MKRIAVQSSSLRAIGYDARQRHLDVDFVSGSRYRYYNVAPDIFSAFLRAESKGRFFMRHVRDRYPTRRLR